jgi:hypothetical protein
MPATPGTAAGLGSAELSPPVRGGRFPLTIVRLAMDLVLQTGSSLRGVAASLRLIAERLGWNVATPSYGTVRSCLLRLGCYALLRPLPAGAWVWLIDHTVQIGAAKLLVIVGCPLAEVPRDRPLRQSDLHLVHLALMEHSTQETMQAELQQAAKRTGIPRQIAADQGSDLEGGVKLWQRQHAGVAHVHDLAHQAANVLKSRWTKDPQWSELVSRLSQTAARLRQTRAAHLLPPTIRAKARFMNVRPTLRFAGRVLRLLERAAPGSRLAEYYGWLCDYREALANWTSEQAAAEAAVAHVRRHGLRCDTAAELDAVWSKLTLTPGGREVAARLCAAIERESAQAQPGETLVGSTEVLESTFGKLKRLEGSYSGDGFTTLSLVLGAILGERSEEEVRQALDTVPKKTAASLARQLLGTTLHQLRRLFIKTADSEPNPA